MSTQAPQGRGCPVCHKRGPECRCGESHEDTHARCDRLERQLRALLREDQPYSLRETLLHLVQSTEHLLHDHSCDAHGYEGWERAVHAARTLLEELGTPAPPHTSYPLTESAHHERRET
jgi:hypothetical protein